MNNQDIDFVIIWVDGNDPAWQQQKAQYVQTARDSMDKELFDKWCNHPMRYRDWDNLRYWFRGVEQFAPWVRKVHFVTWGHLPPWLNTKHPKLNIVNHKDFIPAEYLPTFQANPIENNLHRIEGLAEQFVFFNDDMFLIRATKPNNFFHNGLPCDCAILNMPVTERYGTPYSNNSAAIINSYFQKNEVIKENWRKWFSIKYFPQVVRTCILMPWKRFGVLFQHHLPSSMLKSTYQKVWELEGEELDRTCRQKFRGKEQLNQYIFLDWQRVTGQFWPRSPKVGSTFRMGNHYQLGERDQTNEALAYLEKQKGKMICINDGDMTEEEFEEKKRRLNQSFEKILPQKSKFEL